MTRAAHTSKDSELRSPRPFLKWVGGKRQLLSELHSRIPSSYGAYHEPFIGGGALFFSLSSVQSHISDANSELINAYTVLRDSVEELIEDLQRHRYEEEYYYSIRELDRSDSFESLSPIARASRLIYLNRTCFNGLYRVNRKGQFNTPFGRYENPTICDTDNLRACSEHLEGVLIRNSSFEGVLDRAKSGDFVYFDPPYVPASETANFTGYAKDGFGPTEQERLLEVCRELHSREVKFLLSNSATSDVLDLYSEFQIEEVEASRAVNSDATKRGKVSEYVIRNYR